MSSTIRLHIEGDQVIEIEIPGINVQEVSLGNPDLPGDLIELGRTDEFAITEARADAEARGVMSSPMRAPVGPAEEMHTVDPQISRLARGRRQIRTMRTDFLNYADFLPMSRRARNAIYDAIDHLESAMVSLERHLDEIDELWEEATDAGPMNLEQMQP